MVTWALNKLNCGYIRAVLLTTSCVLLAASIEIIVLAKRTNETGTKDFEYGLVACLTIVVAISTVIASYKKDSVYVLIHSGISAIFMPLFVVVIFIEELGQPANLDLKLTTIAIVVSSIANGITSLLLYAVAKAEKQEDDYPPEANELNTIRGPESIETVNIMKRPSTAASIGGDKEQIAARALAVRFNLTNTPSHSLNAPRKFSLAARRGSSFL